MTRPQSEEPAQAATRTGFDDADEAAALRTAFSRFDEGFCICEMLYDGERTVDYRFLRVNESFKSMSGLPDPTGKTAHEVFPDLEQKWIESYGEVLASGRATRFEQGSESLGTWYDVLVLPLSPANRFALVFRDRTEQRESEAAQRRQTADAHLHAEEHDISIRLQRALLPDRLVQHPGVALSARYEAPGTVLAVGGDWYDSFRWVGGLIGVIVGDVAGHGIEAAAAMGRLRSAMAAIAPYVGPNPGALLDALDQIMRGPNGTTYATACCAVIDPVKQTVRYSSAGHPPMLVVGATGTIVWLDDVQSPPLCHLRVGDRPSNTVELAPGSSVVLYSDGIVERRGESIDVGYERFGEVVRVALATDGPDPASRIVDAAMGGQHLTDDVVVVVMQLLGEPFELGGVDPSVGERQVSSPVR